MAYVDDLEARVKGLREVHAGSEELIRAIAMELENIASNEAKLREFANGLRHNATRLAHAVVANTHEHWNRQATEEEQHAVDEHHSRMALAAADHRRMGGTDQSANIDASSAARAQQRAANERNHEGAARHEGLTPIAHQPGDRRDQPAHGAEKTDEDVYGRGKTGQPARPQSESPPRRTDGPQLPGDPEGEVTGAHPSYRPRKH